MNQVLPQWFMHVVDTVAEFLLADGMCAGEIRELALQEAYTNTLATQSFVHWCACHPAVSEAAQHHQKIQSLDALWMSLCHKKDMHEMSLSILRRCDMEDRCDNEERSKKIKEAQQDVQDTEKKIATTLADLQQLNAHPPAQHVGDEGLWRVVQDSTAMWINHARQLTVIPAPALNRALPETTVLCVSPTPETAHSPPTLLVPLPTPKTAP